MGRFGEVALEAYELIKSQKITDPAKAWKQAAINRNLTESSQNKSCPKNAFIGLCKAGLLKGLNVELESLNGKNAMYALRSVGLLKTKHDSQYTHTPLQLWKEVMRELDEDTDKMHNGQMDVVLALWINGNVL